VAQGEGPEFKLQYHKNKQTNKRGGEFGNTHTHTHTQKITDEKQGEDSHPQTQERQLEQGLPSQPSQRTDPADTLILDFQPPDV
jgi:hypothetical protein